MVIEVVEKKPITIPKFRDPATMSEAELTDPDYRIKKLAIDSGLKPDAIKICSRCHHCR